MSARYQNLNFLKRCGYQTEYDTSGDREQVTIDCLSTNKLPGLRITCWGERPGIKGGANFQINRIRVHNRETQEVKTYDSNARIQRDQKTTYLIPDKAILDDFLSLVDPQGMYEHLWVLAQAMLIRQKRSLKHSEAIKLLQQVWPKAESCTRIQHPLLFTSINNYLAFTSQEMQQYCLAVELNKQRDTAIELKPLISDETVTFLEINELVLRKIDVISELKDQAVRQQAYEKAAQLRNLERDLPVSYLQKSWPHPSPAGAAAFYEEKLRAFRNP